MGVVSCMGGSIASGPSSAPARDYERAAQSGSSEPRRAGRDRNSGCGTIPKNTVAAAKTIATNVSSSCGPAATVGLRRAPGDDRHADGGADARAGRRAHPDRSDHAQVVGERDHRADDEHDRKPGVAAADKGGDQEELADEAGGRGNPGERQHRDRQRPGEPRAIGPKAGDGVDVIAVGRRALARDDHRERGDVHQQVDDQIEQRRPHAELGRDGHAGEDVAGLRDRGIGEHPLERGLSESADVADDDRDRREHRQCRLPVAALADQHHVQHA